MGLLGLPPPPPPLPPPPLPPPAPPPAGAAAPPFASYRRSWSELQARDVDRCQTSASSTLPPLGAWRSSPTA
eukprot:scaffold23375_cov59-Phaeocystis_antarctica.AAC.3